MRILGLGLSMALLSLCFGCGSKGIHIGGSVTFDGKPIEEGTIEFVPVEGTAGPSTGGSIKAGRYQCSKDLGLVRGGHYQVRISALAKTGKTVRNIMQPGGPPLELSENYIPAAYNSNSTLAVIFAPESGKNTFDFQLESQRERR